MILADALKLYCEHNNIRVRALEKVTGVARSTLSRFLNGKSIDSDNFTKLLSWVMQPPEKLLHSVPPKIPDTSAHRRQQKQPDTPRNETAAPADANTE